MNGIVEKIHNEKEKIDRGYLTIPNIIVFDNKLSFLEKFVLGVILSFQYQSQCTASNEWFANQFDVSVRTIERTIKSLEDYGLIERQFNHATKQRKIVPSNIEVWIAYREIRQGSTDKRNDSSSRYNQTTLIKDLKKIWTN
jgi:predicted transcriptional regulator